MVRNIKGHPTAALHCTVQFAQDADASQLQAALTLVPCPLQMMLMRANSGPLSEGPSRSPGPPPVASRHPEHAPQPLGGGIPEHREYVPALEGMGGDTDEEDADGGLRGGRYYSSYSGYSSGGNSQVGSPPGEGATWVDEPVQPACGGGRYSGAYQGDGWRDSKEGQGAASLPPGAIDRLQAQHKEQHRQLKQQRAVTYNSSYCCSTAPSVSCAST